VVRVEGKGQMRGAYRVLVRKSERKRPLRRPSIEGKINLKYIFNNNDGGGNVD
jgi:hypothetical protein